MIRRNSVSRR